MAWIESHQELGRHPKTKRLARTLGVSLPQAVGHLQYFWWWALDFAPDGDLSAFDADELADAALWDGEPGVFLQALEKAGFVDKKQARTYIHDWDDYAGRLVEQREAAKGKTRARVQKYRAKKKAENGDGHVTRYGNAPVTLCNAPTVPNPTVPNPTVHNHTDMAKGKGRTRPAVSDGANGFDLFWKAYPKKAKKADAVKAWSQVKADGLTEAILSALTHFKASSEWSRENGRYIPHPASWLRGRRWEDEFLKGVTTNGTNEQHGAARAVELTGFKDAYDDLGLGK